MARAKGTQNVLHSALTDTSNRAVLNRAKQKRAAMANVKKFIRRRQQSKVSGGGLFTVDSVLLCVVSTSRLAALSLYVRAASEEAVDISVCDFAIFFLSSCI